MIIETQSGRYRFLGEDENVELPLVHAKAPPRERRAIFSIPQRRLQ